MKDRSKQRIKADQKKQRKNQNKTSGGLKLLFSRKKREDIASVERKLAASQKEP